MNRFLTVLLLSTAAFLPDIATARGRYTQDFDRFPNGATDLRDGSTVASNNGVAGVQDDALRLTQLFVNSTHSSYRLPPPGAAAVRGFDLTFEFVMDSQATTPADGFAFNYGALPTDPQSGLFNGAGEEGFGVGLSIEVDTWTNAAESAGYNVVVDGVDVPGGAIRQPPPVDGIWRRAQIVWTGDDEGGRVTFSIDDSLIFDSLPTPGFHPEPSDHFAFSAPHGGRERDAPHRQRLNGLGADVGRQSAALLRLGEAGRCAKVRDRLASLPCEVVHVRGGR